MLLKGRNVKWLPLLLTGIADLVKSILEFDASINFYMFHGGTNFGFMNGANIDNLEDRGYAPDITSYGEYAYSVSLSVKVFSE